MIIIIIMIITIIIIIIIIIIMVMTMMMILIIIMMITIVIALKGAFRDLLQSPHCAANSLQYVFLSGQCPVVCKSHATHRALTTCNM